MEEGNIVAWLKKVGDAVSPGDILAEVETDKATMELESFFEGTLLYIGVPQGPVAVDGIIAIIGNKGEDYKSILENADVPASSKGEKEDELKGSEAPKVETNSSPATDEVKEEQTLSSPEPISSDEGNSGRVKASPLAKSIASTAGVNLSNISGSGEQGRIVKRDVESFIKNPPAVERSTSPQVKAPTPVPQISYGDHPVSQMRKVIAKRLSESKFSAPHFYLTIEVNMDNAISARQAINSDGSVKISFNDFVVKSSAAALRKHPMINSSWLGDKITVHEEINIGVAVAVADGLLVPVIRNADKKSLSYINEEVKVLAGKAKEKKLQPAEMTGNTFTISNLGMFDIDEFTAIINTPDACILAVGSIAQKPIVKNGLIVVGNIMKLTLSCDHRVVDGATAAQFLGTLKAMLENPVKILV
jgi:pyruvate dehydrogenase E2 component (dihydrolipoamide acetyltransferase)